jgi:dCMP deaminase
VKRDPSLPLQFLSGDALRDYMKGTMEWYPQDTPAGGLLPGTCCWITESEFLRVRRFDGTLEEGVFHTSADIPFIPLPDIDRFVDQHPSKMALERIALKRDTYIHIAETIALLGTCCRLKVGCVLLTKEGRVAGMGYNGAGPGMPHCDPVSCNSECRCGRTLHAEQNALFARNAEPYIAYVTHEPCLKCTQELAVAGVREVIYAKPYTSIPDKERADRDEWIRHYHIIWRRHQ